MYDMNTEPGHAELLQAVVHVPLSEYVVGSPRYEKLLEAMTNAQRFTWPSGMETR
jgi:hypothetical protein